MDWKEVGKKIMAVAPTLGGALLGPAGLVGGTALNLIAKAFGMKDEEVTADAVNTILSQDPEAMVRFKEIDLNYRIELKNQENEELKARLSDVQNARTRQVEHEKATGKTDVNLYSLAWLVISGFFILLAFLMFNTLPQANIGPVNQLFGAVSTGFGVVLQFFFGSSRGSQGKTQELVRLAQDKAGK